METLDTNENKVTVIIIYLKAFLATLLQNVIMFAFDTVILLLCLN